MPSLLDTLIGGPPEREDDKRLSVKKRAPPTQARDLFDTFATMGLNASVEGLLRAYEMHGAKPHVLTYAVLGRWPTPAETAAWPNPVKNGKHLKGLLASAEFRAGVVRRLFDAFPEKLRIMFLQLPRCAGGTVMAALEKAHPVLPHNLSGSVYGDINAVVEKLGQVTRLFALTRTMALVLPKLEPFIATPAASAGGPDPFHWLSPEPPCRATDALFAVIRPPVDLALSQVNGILTKLRGDFVVSLPAGLSPPPVDAEIAVWRTFGRTLLRKSVSQNPVCTALADGTSAGALAMCACSPITLVGFDRYSQWGRSALGDESDERINRSERIVRLEDLDQAERAWLEQRIAEDQAFYARFKATYEAAGLPAIAGATL